MVAYQIKEIGEYNYFTLENIETKTQTKLQIEFYGVDEPKLNDTIIFEEILLKRSFEGFCQPYAFMLCDKSPKEVEGNKEYLVLISNKNKYVLKRVYG